MKDSHRLRFGGIGMFGFALIGAYFIAGLLATGAAWARAGNDPLPRMVGAIVGNASDEFVSRAMARFSLGDIPLGQLSVRNLECRPTAWVLEKDGTYAVDADVKWKSLLAGGTGLRAKITVGVNPKDWTFVVIPNSLDDNARMLLNGGDLLAQGLNRLGDETYTWNTKERALAMFRGQLLPPLPAPPAAAAAPAAAQQQLLDGPHMHPQSADKHYTPAPGLELRTAVVQNTANSIAIGDDGLPNWKQLSSAVNVGGGDMLVLDEKFYRLKMNPGDSVAFKWSSGNGWGFAAVARKPDGAYMITDNSDNTTWRALNAGVADGGFVWQIGGSVPLQIRFILDPSGTLVYNACFTTAQR